MQEVVFVAAARTAIGSLQGGLAGIPAHEVGAAVIRRLLEQTGLPGTQVDEVIFGQVLMTSAEQNPAHQASILAGLPHSVPAMTLNMLCGSTLEAMRLGVQAIRSGDADVIIAGGQESMSLAPYLLSSTSTDMLWGPGKALDSMIQDGLTDALNHYRTAITAENLLLEYELRREQHAAITPGRFKGQITSPPTPQHKGDPVVFDTDEGARADTAAESLAKLKPTFRNGSSATSGNVSTVNDGAAAVLLMSNWAFQCWRESRATLMRV